MIPVVSINYVAVLVAAIVSYVIGALWYSVLFKKPWMQLMGFDKKKIDAAKKQGMGKLYAASFITTLITSFVLAHIVKFVAATSFADALMIGFWTWLGFVATMMVGTVLWEGKPVKLYAINVSHYLVCLLVMSAILVAMP